MKDRRSGIDRYLENLKGELEGATLYRMMAGAEETPALAEVYNRLAGVEERHAEVWREKIRLAGEEVPDFRPSIRLRLIGWLARRFGAGLVLPFALSSEVGDSTRYGTQTEAREAGLPAEER